MFESIVKSQLVRHEGVRLKPYKDTVGKLTIGIGRNLDDIGISQDESDLMFENDVKRAVKDSKALISNFDALNDNRKAVIVNLVFNMGIKKFSEFKKTISAIESCDFETAAIEMKDSTWYRQVGSRAVELCELMRTG